MTNTDEYIELYNEAAINDNALLPEEVSPELAAAAAPRVGSAGNDHCNYIILHLLLLWGPLLVLDLGTLEDRINIFLFLLRELAGMEMLNVKTGSNLFL